MRYFNFSPVTVERFCMHRGFVDGREKDIGKMIVFTRQKYTEVPDNVYIPETEFLPKGIIAVPYDADKEELQRIQFKALQAYLHGDLAWKISGYQTAYDAMRNNNKVVRESPDYIQAMKWQEEIYNILEMSPVYEAPISLLETVGKVEVVEDPVKRQEIQVDNPFSAEQAKRKVGRPARSQEPMVMEI